MYEAFTTKQIEVLMGCRQSLSFPFFFSTHSISSEYTSICLNASRTRPYMSRERKTVRSRLDIFDLKEKKGCVQTWLDVEE